MAQYSMTYVFYKFIGIRLDARLLFDNNNFTITSILLLSLSILCTLSYNSICLEKSLQGCFDHVLIVCSLVDIFMTFFFN